MSEIERETEAGAIISPADAQRCDEAERFQLDLYLVWRTIASSGGLPLSARGALTRTAHRRVQAALVAGNGSQPGGEASDQDETRTAFLLRLLERLMLVKRDGEASRLVASPIAHIERYLAQSLADRLRLGAKMWVAGGWWPDVIDLKAEPPRVMAPASPRVAVARKRLLDALAAASPGNERPYPTVPSPGHATAGRPVRPAPGRAPGRGVETATAGDEVTWRVALRGPLAWMGFVAPVSVESAGAASGARYRVTSAAQALRGGAAALLVDTSGRVAIQSDFSIVAYPPLQPRLLLTLDQIADEVSLERTARYTLTRASFGRARRAGLDAATVVARLEAAAGVPLPGNVAVTLADWGRASERVTLHEGVALLEVAEARTLDSLLADRTGAQWIARRLSPTAALVGSEHVGRVRGWLLRRGECPAVQ